MLLRFLLNLIKPSNEQLRCKNIGKFIRLKIWLYQLLLRRLLKTYLHYAISDTIIIDNGNIKIVHEFRDLGFESELVRNKINFKDDLISHSIPLSKQKGKSTCNFHFFKFKNLLSLYVGGKEMFIKHDDLCSIDGTLQGKIKCSSKNSCFSQSVIEILSLQNSIEPLNATTHQKTKLEESNKPANKQQRVKNSPQNIFGRERDILPIREERDPKTDKPEVIHDIQPKAIEKKGFDIDTSF